ncbi:aspartyl-phosphate phosphatase Spo0E family protein [Domibacillus sp. PGB-M46]|uniref:aspartyl-phosphate phosphatase Spo0E family protein n=1 Tax=Domibacillus sp. PGB-M46 TaxID=2910255 RepID=UPI0021042E29|nr:aspartyl-phosphate phosphatase Spo0E family protein [Domibacillus sp. PGB-M46]
MRRFVTNEKQGAFCKLPAQINNLRHLMIKAGRQYGLSSQKTLRYSEQLEELILQYQLQNRGMINPNSSPAFLGCSYKTF